MKQKSLKLLLLFSLLAHINAYGTDSLKGIWSDIKSFPPFTSGFWKGIGQSFGGSPSGYVYSFDLYNDMRQPVYFSITEIISVMGGNLPKPHGFSLYSVDSFKNQQITDQPYYFELLIKSSNTKYSSNMPYLSHPDVLCRHEAITLNGSANSKKMHYYRAFMGKKLVNGVYVHEAQAESLGYDNSSGTDSQSDPGDVTIGTTLSGLTLYNSSSTDYYFGFISGQSQSSFTKASCNIYELIPAKSFALIQSTATLTTLSPGTIGLFDVATGQLLQAYNLPINIFETIPSMSSMPYTLEIYADSGEKVQMDMQGLMSGNYDQPIGKVRDVTPVTCVLWYDKATSATGNDLPGTLWVVSVADRDRKKISLVSPGQAVQFFITRPIAGEKLWIYFIYVATKDSIKAKQFIDNFLQGSFASKGLDAYQLQAEQQMKLVKESAAVNSGDQISESILVQASQGVLSLQGGKINDPVSGVAGYLLGGDIFLPQGVGSGPFYYYLAPSSDDTLPLSVVQNYYVNNPGSTTAPKGMPMVIQATVNS